ncbi:biotin--[acetyl-CoA-carboxylase] ligase [Rhodohalobacter halophilus]|uniref:biotin--[acetyl-CoA-carboxylase] ligase n=1 Tax=Rhodohalobacter halophilus TaxID=1812810 RepID=UPI00083FBC07|nr:biotin--[acetyl-CoA-carboxylase] ligase [Rhodohalobacter halophilus]
MGSRPFHTEQFKENLKTKWLGRTFHFIEEVGSTNSYLKRIPENELTHGEVVVANHQTEGRGQHQKKWIADPGLNLTFTAAFKPGKADRLSLLTLAFAYGVLTVLRRYTYEAVFLKWPNDLYVGSKKIGGVLTECTFLGVRPERTLIGVGLNIFQENFPKELEGEVAALCQVSSKEIHREQLLAEVLNACEMIYENWAAGDSELHKSISRNLIGYGEWVRLKIDNELLDDRYKFLGVNEKGELLVLNNNLELNTYSHEQIRIISGSESISKIR